MFIKKKKNFFLKQIFGTFCKVYLKHVILLKKNLTAAMIVNLIIC